MEDCRSVQHKIHEVTYSHHVDIIRANRADYYDHREGKLDTNPVAVGLAVWHSRLKPFFQRKAQQEIIFFLIFFFYV